MGLNVAAVPLFTMAYIGVSGGLVIVSADDPGCHSSQNEQDNRLYAPLARILMLEPSDSQECLDFTKAAFELSERFDLPVLLRVTTRSCHSKSQTVLSDRVAAQPKVYERNPAKNAMLPVNARGRHLVVEEHLAAAEVYANQSPFNKIEWGLDKKIGVVTSGICYQHAREVFGDSVSYLKLGFTHPLPHKLMHTFARSVDRLYVIEEGMPYLEDALRAQGFAPLGRELLPGTGELDASLIRRAFLPSAATELLQSEIKAPPRPPVLCPGCPHRGFFHTLNQRHKDMVVTGDIGCYTLGIQPPLNGLDTVICMGAGFSAAIGMAQALRAAGDPRKVFGVLGDSTFFHSGITGLVDAARSQLDLCLCILDNNITAMTGHQDNPGTQKSIMGDSLPAIDIVDVVRAMKVSDDKLWVIDPLDMTTVKETIDKALAAPGLSVIVARRPCVLIKEVRKTLEGHYCQVDPDACKKCKKCLKVGCPSIAFKDGHSNIDITSCVGCQYCQQVCPFDAISKFTEARS